MTAPANGYIVISWWQAKSSNSHQGDYAYDYFTDLEEALTTYREYEHGEFSRAREIAICEACNGIPTGVRLHPHSGSPMSSGQRAELLEQVAAEGLAAQPPLP